MLFCHLNKLINRSDVEVHVTVCVVGCTDDMSNRIKQHVNGSLSSSAMKRNLAGILKDKNLLEDIIDGINFECIATEQGEKVKEDSLKKYVYILYKNN